MLDFRRTRAAWLTRLPDLRMPGADADDDGTDYVFWPTTAMETGGPEYVCRVFRTGRETNAEIGIILHRHFEKYAPRNRSELARVANPAMAVPVRWLVNRLLH
jgi:hypothetical protein